MSRLMVGGTQHGADTLSILQEAYEARLLGMSGHIDITVRFRQRDDLRLTESY